MNKRRLTEAQTVTILRALDKGSVAQAFWRDGTPTKRSACGNASRRTRA